MKKNANNKFDLKTYLQNNSLPILLQVIALLVVIINLWIASKLAPVAQGVDKVTTRVDALEKYNNDEVKPYIKKTIEVKKDIDYIKQGINDLNKKMDQYIQQVISLVQKP